MSQTLSKQARNTVGLMMLGAFIASLTQTALAPALPSIMRDLSIDAAMAQWLTTIFMLVNGIMIPCTAYLMARFKTRTLYLFSMSLFFVGTLMAGLAKTFFLLLVARVLQALCFGILMPLLSGTLLMLVPPEHRGKAMGMFGLIIGVAPAIGPSLAGFVIDAWGWQSFYLLLSPIVLLDILLSFFAMGHGGETKAIPLDFTSVVLSTVGFGGLLYGFSAAGSYGWLSAHTLVALVVGAWGTTVFMRRQKRLAVPLLRLEAFQNQNFTIGTIISMTMMASMIFGSVLTPIYLQDIHGYSAFGAALVMLPAAMLSIILNPVAGNLFDKYGGRKIILMGGVLIILGTVGFCLFDVDSPTWFLVLAYTVRLGGTHIAITPANTWSMLEFTGESIPHANALSNTFRQIASSVGTAVFVSIYMMASAAYGGDAKTAALFGFHVTFGVSLVMLFAVLLLGYFKIERPQKNK